MRKQCGDQYLMKLYAAQDGLWADTFIKISKWESTRMEHRHTGKVHECKLFIALK